MFNIQSPNPHHTLLTSSLAIDIIIPAIDQDIEVLTHTIDAARLNVKHPIDNIFIIAPESQSMRNLCKEKGCIYINEDTVLPIHVKDIDYKVKEAVLWEGKLYDINRSGWIFQQLLKLSGDTISSNTHYLVIDADTLLIQPQVFEIEGKTRFNCSNWYHKAFFEIHEKLLGSKTLSPPSMSFICHHMLFETSKLKHLKQIIERNHQKPWYQAIIDNLDKKEMLGFSEYETYGNFVLSYYPESMYLEEFTNFSLRRKEIEYLETLDIPELSKRYKTLSFHGRGD